MKNSPLRRFFESYLIAVVLFLLPIMLKEKFSSGMGPTTSFILTIVWGPILFLGAGYLISRAHLLLHSLCLLFFAISGFMVPSKGDLMDPMGQLTSVLERRFVEGLEVALILGLLLSAANQYFQSRKTDFSRS